jgi:hypothetical protein
MSAAGGTGVVVALGRTLEYRPGTLQTKHPFRGIKKELIHLVRDSQGGKRQLEDERDTMASRGTTSMYRTTANVSCTVNIQTPLFQRVLGLYT